MNEDCEGQSETRNGFIVDVIEIFNPAASYSFVLIETFIDSAVEKQVLINARFRLGDS